MSKRIRLSLIAAASLMTLALISFYTTQASPTAASPDGAVKIGVIDTEKILLSSSTGKAALANLKKLQESKESEIRVMAQEIKDLQTKIQDGRQSLPQDQLAQLQKQLDDKTSALSRKQDDSKRELDRKRDEVLAQIDVKVMPAINQIGKEMGYTTIFRKFESGLIYADEAIDITALVIQRLDAGGSGLLLPPTPSGAPGGIPAPPTSGNVGIGTASPSHHLHVLGTGIQTIAVESTQNGNNAQIVFIGKSSGGTAQQWQLGENLATTAGNFELFDTTAGQARILVTTSGRVGVGTTAPTDTLSVNGTASKPGGGSWAVFSDERLKNIKGQFTSGLEAVMQLQPLRYEYRRDNTLGLKSDGMHVGFGAQAVQKIIPEAVTRTDSGYLMVNNDPIIWTMLNAIKEQQKQIAELKSELRKSRGTARRGK